MEFRADFLLQTFDDHSAVFGPAGRGIVWRNRLGFTISLGHQPFRGDIIFGA